MKSRDLGLLFLAIILGVFGSCSKKDEPVPPVVKSLPTVTTTAISNITGISAISGGNVSSDGNATVSERGVCWSTEANPSTIDNKTNDSSGTGSFTSNLTGLNAYNTYFVRAYATNSEGTAYGGQEEFRATKGSMTDSRDGKTYNYVVIGDQTWMAENLAYLPEISISSNESDTDPYYYVLGYEGTDLSEAKATDNYSKYGVLYNWPAAMDGNASSEANPSGVQGACPTGWHLPSDDEWKQLEKYIGMSQTEADNIGNRGTIEGKKLKSTSEWYNSIGTDDFGFNVVPGGYGGGPGGFNQLGIYALFWSSSKENDFPYYRQFSYISDAIIRYTAFSSEPGHSVRCVKD